MRRATDLHERHPAPTSPDALFRTKDRSPVDRLALLLCKTSNRFAELPPRSRAPMKACVRILCYCLRRRSDPRRLLEAGQPDVAATSDAHSRANHSRPAEHPTDYLVRAALIRLSREEGSTRPNDTPTHRAFPPSESEAPPSEAFPARRGSAGTQAARAPAHPPAGAMPAAETDTASNAVSAQASHPNQESSHCGRCSQCFG